MVHTKKIYAILLGCLCLFCSIFFIRNDHFVFVLQPEEIDSNIKYILDAGHGGEDGGAVSITGIPESHINLSIVLKLDALMGFLGEAPYLLRTEDISLHDETAVTVHEKKVSDLKNRVHIASKLNHATLISIHQNTYQEAKYHGTQVFYAPTDGSKELAEKFQAVIRNNLQPTNKRQEKQITDSVYLMNHIPNRAVLIECGFLTNPEEEALLQKSEYQKKLAIVFANVICSDL